MKNKIIAYKENNNWVINSNGYLLILPHWLTTKKMVRSWIKEQNNNASVIFVNKGAI